MDRTILTRLAVATTAALALAACGGTTARGAETDPSGAPATGLADPSAGPMDADTAEDELVARAVALSAAGQVDDDLRRRCIEGIRILDRRWDEEGFEYPDEGPELSEEELEQSLAPPMPYTDGVAGPDERPALTALAPYDPQTLPIPQLDRFREACFEHGLVTEAEVYGEDGSEDDHEAWCAELASLSPGEVREFVADEGPEVVDEEFEACDLENPLDP